MAVLWVFVCMDSYSVVDDWEMTRFDGGFDGLAELESRGFSGAVEAGETWAFFRDGKALATVSDLRSTPIPAEIDAFEDADGKRYDAPTSGAATLAAMLALDGDVRGRYFTDDTPLEAVHETLSGGGFTGYVELSENVLSGDYYFVYVDGEVEHLGFVGTAPMISGEKAERKAKNEVGIYAVVAVQFPEIELPEPTVVEAESEDEGEQDESESEPTLKPEATAEPEPTSESEPTPEREATAEPEPTTEPEAPSEPKPTEVTDTTTETEPTPEADPDRPDQPATNDEPTPKQVEAADAPEPQPAAKEPETVGEPASQSSKSEREVEQADDESARRSDSSGYERPASSESTVEPDDPVVDESSVEAPSGAGTAAKSKSRQEPEGIEAVTVRTVPSLDPEQSNQVTPEKRSISASKTAQQTAATKPDRRTETTEKASSDRSLSIEQLQQQHEEQISEYEERIGEYEEQIETLESELTTSDGRVEALEAELESIRNERDELRAQIEASGTPSPSGTSLSAPDALARTSLFVREASRGEATLEDARDSGVDRETVTANLRIEHHTEFEDDGTTVEGKPFETWLRSSDTYAFVEWLIIDLFFEIRSTGAVDGLRPLYDALPEIDRISFEDSITVGSGKEGRKISFDIVARDKKGNPLVVVEFDRRREPTRAETIEPFVTDASDVCEMHESLAAAVAVTSSYFESDAMATTEEATGTSLLSRSKHRSYVKLSRTSGYHLCLVEARDESFNLTVPEL